ncbi:hypothetical protein CTI12_AA378830 [Artemisia annua]|uniref:Uncharacterized protein n=1 Tax=Artemisia annua TaxID=35608 RepID=A0A2U1MHY6_ARTAN|nr:hypothetical protein CTI12_AA378830 [Artemisia annua]
MKELINIKRTKGVLDQLENKEVVVLEKDSNTDDAEKEVEDEQEEVITEEVEPSLARKRKSEPGNMDLPKMPKT